MTELVNATRSKKDRRQRGKQYIGKANVDLFDLVVIGGFALLIGIGIGGVVLTLSHRSAPLLSRIIE